MLSWSNWPAAAVSAEGQEGRILQVCPTPFALALPVRSAVASVELEEQGP